MLSAFSAPWDLRKPIKRSFINPYELPGVTAYPCTYIPASQTGTGYATLAIRIFLDGYTGNYWAKAKIRVYCRLWGVTGPGSGGPFPNYPMGWIWDYKTWEVEVAPNSWYGDAFWDLTGDETFNTYWTGDHIAILESDTELVSWEQE